MAGWVDMASSWLQKHNTWQNLTIKIKQKYKKREKSWSISTVTKSQNIGEKPIIREYEIWDTEFSPKELEIIEQFEKEFKYVWSS